MVEMDLSLPTSILATIFVLLLAILYHIFHSPSTKKIKKPPQARGALPIIGHIHLLNGLAHKTLGDMADRYGPIFTIKLGFQEALVVSDKEMAKECLTTHDRVFATRPKAAAVEIMGYDYALFGFAPYGEYWRQIRKVSTLELLSLRRLEMLRHVRVSEVNCAVRDILELSKKERGDGNSGMVKMEMKQWLGGITLNVIVRILSGKRYAVGDEEGDRFREAIRKFIELLGAFVLSDTIPGIRWLDLGGYEKAMKAVAEEIDEILEIWLGEHRRKRDSGRQVVEGEECDFIDVLLSRLEGGSAEALLGRDASTAIKSTCLAVLSAATDTTIVTLTWALSLLLNNPHVMKNARHEIDTLVGKERLVEESDMKKLVYLDAIIKETLRLYPPVPLSLPHESTDDCVVSGYHIPKGTRLLVNIWKIHHDPNIWSSPFEFRPERFLTSQKDTDYRGQHFELIPFGSGRRMCPGISFAEQVVQLTLARLIQGFEIENPSTEPIDLTESSGLTNLKHTPLDVLLMPRLPLNLYH